MLNLININYLEIYYFLVNGFNQGSLIFLAFKNSVLIENVLYAEKNNL